MDLRGVSEGCVWGSVFLDVLKGNNRTLQDFDKIFLDFDGFKIYSGNADCSWISIWKVFSMDEGFWDIGSFWKDFETDD